MQRHLIKHNDQNDLLKPVTLQIVDFGKRLSDENSKFYVYSIQVVTANSKQYTIWRRYSEFFSLHVKLRVVFAKDGLPKLPPKHVFQRSQIRSVAVTRMQELNVYLQALLAMPQVRLESATTKV